MALLDDDDSRAPVGDDFDGASLPQIGQRDDSERGRIIAAATEDFLDFCSLLEVQPKEGGGRVPFILSPTQRALNAARTGRDVALKGRQVHVTTLECARDLFVFITREGAHVLVIVQSQTDMKPFKDVADKFRIFIDSLRKAGLNLKFGAESLGEWTLPERDSMLTIIQAGASAAAAVKKGRGGHVTRLHCTETSVWEHADLTLSAVLPSVPHVNTGSEVVVESTANGAGGVYYDLWQSAVRGQNGYRPHFLRWWMHPEYALALEPGEVVVPSGEPGKSYEHKLMFAGATPENLKWYRQKMAEPGMGRDKTLQEYPVDPQTCFLVSGRPFFESEIVQTLIHEADPPKRTEQHGSLRIWLEPVAGANYVVAVDPAEGSSPDNSQEKSDYCAAGVFRRNGQHCATLHGRWTPWEFARLLAPLARRYNWAEIAVERNNHGWSVLEGLSKGQRYPLDKIWHAPDGKWGWHTNNVTRPQMLDKFDEAVRAKDGPARFRTNDTLALGEMQSFVFGPNGKPEAAQGCHDDLVIMAAIGWSVICRPMGPRRNLQHLPPR